MTIQSVAYSFIEEEEPIRVITRCGESDCCPGCGAAYRIGVSQCDYCKRPVALVAQTPLVAQDPDAGNPTTTNPIPQGQPNDQDRD